MTGGDAAESLALNIAGGLIVLHMAHLTRIDKVIINKELFRPRNIVIILVVAIIVHYVFGRWTMKGSASADDSAAS